MTLRLIHEAGLSLWRARQRAALAAISISVGIAAVIAMVTIGKIVENETLRQFKSVGTDYFVVTFADTKILGPLDPASTEKFAANLPSVRQLVPFVAGKAAVQHGRTLTYASVLGVEERFASVNHLALVSGRQLHSLDHTKTFCVLGAALADSLELTGADAVGQSVRIKGINHKIVGVLQSHFGGSLTPFDVYNSVLIPFARARRAFPENPPDSLFGRINPSIDPRQLPEEISNYFQRFHQETEAYVTTAEEAIGKLEDQTRTFTLLLGAIAAISLIVGGVGVMNLMLLALAERRVEIGLRRALGAEQRQVRHQFMLEALILCLLGGVLGTTLGLGGAWTVAHFAVWPFELYLPAVVLGVGVSCAVGLFFGYYPAYVASRTDIITALRSRR